MYFHQQSGVEQQQSENEPLVVKFQQEYIPEPPLEFYSSQPLNYNPTLFAPESSQIEDKFAQAMELISSSEGIAHGAIHAALITGMRLMVLKYQSYGIAPKECEVKPHFPNYATLSDTVKKILNSCFVERLNAWFLLKRNLSSEQKSILMLQLAHMLHKFQIEWKYESREPFVEKEIFNLLGQKLENKSDICFNIKDNNRKEDIFFKTFEKDLNKKLDETISVFGKKYLTIDNNVQYLPFTDHSLDSSKSLAQCIVTALMKGMRLVHRGEQDAWEIVGISVTQSLETVLNNKLIKLLTDKIQKNNFMDKNLEIAQKYQLVVMIAKQIQLKLKNEEFVQENHFLNFTYKENCFVQAISNAIFEFEQYCLTQENDTSIIPPLTLEEEPVSCQCVIL